MSPELIDNLLLAGGAGLAVAAAVQVWRAVDFMRHAVRTEGRVVGYTTKESSVSQQDGRGSETVRHDYPDIQFSLPDGSRVGFTSRVPILLGRGPGPGATVRVAYNPKAPAKTAEIAGFRVWFALGQRAFGFMVFAVLLVYMAVKGWTH